MTCTLSVAWAAGPCFVFPTVGLALAATDEEKAGARALAEQALQEAYPQGQYAQAVDLLRRAEALVHSPTHWLYIGMAQVKLGHLALAQEAFLKASREPIDDNSPEAFKVAVATANSELEALKPRIAKVTIRLVGVETSTATVSIDGTPVPSALVGVPMPVDPGEREFQATAPGMVAAVQKLTVTEGTSTNLELTLVADPSAQTITTGGGSGDVTSDGGTSSPADTGGSKDLLLYSGIGAAALGVGGLVGGYFVYSGGDAPRSNADALYSECHQPAQGLECDTAQKAQIKSWDDEADGREIPGKVIMVAGGVFLGAGATLIVLSLLQDDQPQQANGLHVTPWIGVNGGGLSGTF